MTSKEVHMRNRSIFTILIFFLLFTTRVETVKAGEVQKIPIVLYHYVDTVKNSRDQLRKNLTITPLLFDQQLTSLRQHGYQSHFVRDIPDLLAGEKLPEKPLVLTFDDGYEDFYTQAFPLLKSHGMKATLYVVSDFIGKPGYLNAREIRELEDSGLVEIGAHTLNHVWLKSAPDDIARMEIIQSKRQLEKLLNTQITTFAYPYGMFSDEVLRHVENAGFTAAVSVIPGTIQSEDNLFFLSRIRAGLLPACCAAGILEKL